MQTDDSNITRQPDAAPKPRKKHKILRAIVLSILCLILLIILIPVAIYIPPVQDFLVGKASEIVADKTGMKIGVGQFRLKFPLDVSLQNVSVIEASGDTMVMAKEVVADVKLLPLLHLDAQINRLSLLDAYYRMASADTSMILTINAGLLDIDDKSSANFGSGRINLNEALLKDGKIGITMDVWKQKPSPSDSSSTPFVIKANSLKIENILFTMSMLPTIDTLQFKAAGLNLKNSVIDLEKSKMSLGNVSAADGYALMLAPSAEYVSTHPAPAPDTTANSSSAPFVINADSISLAGFYARYAVKDAPEAKGFNPSDIRVSDLNIVLENFQNSGPSLSLPISTLSGNVLLGAFSGSAAYNGFGKNRSVTDNAAKEPRLQILPESKGIFSMDSTGMNIKNFHILTPNSRIDADVAIPNALLEMKPDALLSVDVEASLGLADIVSFMPDVRKFTASLPAATPLNAVVNASGLLSDADIERFEVKIPGTLSLRAKGKAKNALDLKQLVANLNFEGELQRPSIIKNFVELPGVDIPALSLKGNASAARENYTADFNLITPRGSVVGDGKVGMNSAQYQAHVNVRNLNVGSFIGDTLIGNLTANLMARGAGFNPEKKNAHTDIKLNLDEFTYNHQTLKDIDLEATLQNGAFSLDANSFSSPLNFNLAGNGNISDDLYQADIVADIRNVDLLALGFSNTLNHGSGRIHIKGNASPRVWNYDVTLDVGSIDWVLPDQNILLPKGISAHLVADSIHTTCNVDARGTSLSFVAASGLQGLISSFSDVAALMPEIMEQKRVDVHAIESKLPPFLLKANVLGDGIADDFLSSSGVAFGNFNLNLKKDSILQGNMDLNSLKMNSMTLDTITFGIKSRGQLLDYDMHLGNRPGTLDEFASVNMSGYIGENRLSAYLVQHNIKQQMGYRLGFTASLADSIMSVRFTPLKATIAYMPWKFNMDNYVDLNMANKRIEANLEASSDESSILLRTEPVADGGNSLHLNLKNIHIQDFLKMSLNAPPLTADVNSDITVRYNGRALLGKGSLDVSDLVYEKKKVGNLAMTLAAGMGNKGRSGGKLGFLVNGAEAAAIQFLLAPDTINPNGSLVAEHLQLDLTRFPLSIANAFLPPSSMSLSGYLNGEMNMSGSLTSPVLNGSVQSDSIGVFINMLGSSLTLSDNPIVVSDNVLKFKDFNIYAVNSNPLSINGQVDATKFSNILLDLKANAKNMQLSSSKKKNSKADISGNLFVDLDAAVSGPMSLMDIDATLNVLPTTDVTYNLAMGGSDMLSSGRASDDVVRFVNFADSTLVAKADSLSSSMTMRITAKAIISQGTQVTVDLGGSGKVECNPSGTLNYFQNFMGDMKLNGTLYTGTGYARYKIPVLGTKSFDFDRNSHITWSGDILNPMLDILATDEMKTNIQMNGNSRLVNFIVSLKVGNTLSAPSVGFDLATDDDMSISNELQSMTAEQRQQQAMNLLLTGTYTGPGAKSVNANAVTGNLYSFLTSQLNQFAAKNIKGVDINFGVNQYEVGTDGNTSTNTSYSYQVSKSLINNRFKIVVGGNYSTDASADENFQQNLISDIAFEYILKQTNNMSLNARLFRHTGFESVLEGEITETGVGLSLRRRLAFFSELTHFGLSKLWKKPKKTDVPLPADSVVNPDSVPTLLNTNDLNLNENAK